MSDAFEYDMASFIPFRNREVCKHVRAIKRADLCDHPNPNFRMSIVEGFDEIQLDYALDLTSTIKQAAEEGRQLALLLPASISPYAAPMINAMGISCQHVHTFNMDEYADQDGRSAPASWPFSFQKKVWDNFFGRIDEKLRPPISLP